MARKPKEVEGEGGEAESFTPEGPKAGAKKLPGDPVKVKCSGVTGDDSEGVTELKFKYQGKNYVIPVGGTMDGTMPREAADLLIQRAERYWTLKAKLAILEPSFK